MIPKYEFPYNKCLEKLFILNGETYLVRCYPNANETVIIKDLKSGYLKNIVTFNRIVRIDTVEDFEKLFLLI